MSAASSIFYPCSRRFRSSFRQFPLWKRGQLSISHSERGCCNRAFQACVHACERAIMRYLSFQAQCSGICIRFSLSLFAITEQLLCVDLSASGASSFIFDPETRMGLYNLLSLSDETGNQMMAMVLETPKTSMYDTFFLLSKRDSQGVYARAPLS